jgi:VWFA-related protein
VRSRFPILLLACGLCAQQDPTIRLDVQQVLVPVIVTDKKGHHVTGLRTSDFQIYEDGVRQDIAAFSADTSASVDDIGVLSKAASEGPKRTFVICIDTLHTAPASISRLRDALVGLFDKEKASDAQYVLIGIGRQMQVLQPATPNPQVLLLKLRGTAFQSLTGGLDSSSLTAELQNLRSRMDEFCRRCACARPSQHTCDAETETLRQNVDAEVARWTAPAAGLTEQFGNVVRELAKLPTARTLILVSDGFSVDPKREFYSVVSTYLPTNPQFKQSETQEVEPGLRDALKVAADRNVLIYTVDSRGGSTPSLVSAGPMDAGTANTAVIASSLDRIARPASAGTRAETLQTPSRLQTNPFSAEDGATMERIAHATGGVYFRGGSDIQKDFRNALADGREYYVVAYVPKNSEHDGKYRTITVTVSGKELNVRAKSGYWATAQ